ncbi:uncharacterized protein LOC143614506 [Bidens hawaiensis]|uniref:uncharacterized protein LOC143614506 n=1 Tax=Bidens hawaiensis TaxID=980011 RepID=UPI004049768B
MHWEWEACHVAWQGQYHQGDHDGSTVIFEAAASFDLWIWHAFFGMPGANNDVAVINASPIFDRLTDGVSPDISFSTNNVNYEYGYYLVDGIYPEWATLVLTFTYPTDEKRQYFKKKHESARKDIERAFSVLKKYHSSHYKPRGSNPNTQLFIDIAIETRLNAPTVATKAAMSSSKPPSPPT